MLYACLVLAVLSIVMPAAHADTSPDKGIKMSNDTTLDTSAPNDHSQDLQDAEGTPIEIETVKTDSFEMDYIRFGHGPETFVIIPGLSLQSVLLSKDAIAKQYDAMTEDYTLYVFDRRKILPQSYSIEEAAEDTADALSILQLHDINLFGVSQGGMIAMEIAISNPGLVKKLVLGSTCADMSGSNMKVIDEWIRLAKEGDASALYDAFAKAIYPESVYEQYKQVFADSAQTVTQDDLDRFIISAEMMRGFNVLDDLDKISCPTLVLGAADDHVLSADASKQIAEKLKDKPGFEFYMYDGYGHAAFDTAPDYLERVTDFLSK